MKTTRPFKYQSKSAAESDQSFGKSLGQDFAKLKSQWDRKLAKSGFQDIEDHAGQLKQPNIRTIAWANRDVIREFFLRLDRYLTKHDEVPPLHRRVLEMYSAGVYATEICKSVRRSRTTVKNIIRRYKLLILKSYW